MLRVVLFRHKNEDRHDTYNLMIDSESCHNYYKISTLC